MFQLGLVDIDWYLGPTKILQSSSMVKVQMPHDHHLDVFDVMTGLFNLLVQFLALIIVHTSKYIVERRTPDFGIIYPTQLLRFATRFGRPTLAGASFEKDQSLCRVFNENRRDHQLPSLSLWIWVRRRGCSTLSGLSHSFYRLRAHSAYTALEPSFLRLEIS